MKLKKTFVKIISVLMCLSIVSPICAIEGNTVSTAGQDCIDLIKECEGFSQYKYWDYSQWTIGYGTGVAADEYPDGITEAEAEKLLRNVLSKYEGYVNAFANEYGIELTQNQFDALVSLSYNMGNIWSVYDDFDLKSYLIDGSENHSFLEIAQGFGEWRKAGGEVLQGLVNRRADETALFLSDRTNNSEIWRVNTQSGINLRSDAGANNEKTGFLPMNTIYEVTEKKTYNGALWGKTVVDGEEHWGVLEYSKYIVGGPIDYEGGETSSNEKSEKWVITSERGVNLREGPGLEYESLAVLDYTTEFTVTQTVESEEHIWGKTKYNDKTGWVALTYAEPVGDKKFETISFEGIYISSPPDKTKYKEGEMLDLKGIEVKAKYSDGSTKTVTDFTIDGFKSISGEHEVVVTYMEKTASFTVKVSPKKIIKLEIESLPEQVIYKEDEELNTKGLAVKAIYDNETEELLKDDEYKISGYDGSPGVKKVSVKYEAFEVRFEVEVTEKQMTGLQITTPPDKLKYIVGQRLDLSGMQVHAFFDNGSKSPIAEYSTSGYNPNKEGIQEVTIGYNGFYTTFEVKVGQPDIYEMPGDLNADETRDIFDLILMNRLVFEGRTEFSAERFYLADVNGDGNYDENDIEALSRIVSEQ